MGYQDPTMTHMVRLLVLVLQISLVLPPTLLHHHNLPNTSPLPLIIACSNIIIWQRAELEKQIIISSYHIMLSLQRSGAVACALLMSVAASASASSPGAAATVAKVREYMHRLAILLCISYWLRCNLTFISCCLSYYYII